MGFWYYSPALIAAAVLFLVFDVRPYLALRRERSARRR